MSDPSTGAWRGPRRVHRRVVVAALASALALGGCGAAVAGGPGTLEADLVVAAGSTQGVYHAWAGALAEEVTTVYPASHVAVLATTGSIQNLRMLDDGSATFALATSDTVVLAMRGEPPFAAPVPVAAVARIYDDYVHLIVREESTVSRVSDLAGRRVAVGSPGSGTALIAGRALEAAGVSDARTRPLGLVEGTRALADGSVDALFWSGGLPTTAVADLAAHTRIRLVPLDDIAAALRSRWGAAYRPATVPPGTYGAAAAVPTIAVPNLLICRQDSPGSVVRAVLAVAFAHRDVMALTVPAGNTLDRRAAIATSPVPLHAAAVRFYRETKP
jgi:TRAP transporter TAXI family solute receptor